MISSEGYFRRALTWCTDQALGLLDIIIERGGTTGSLVDVERAFGAHHDPLYFFPSHRVLTRLGLAYAVDGATRHYYLLAEGVISIASRSFTTPVMRSA